MSHELQLFGASASPYANLIRGLLAEKNLNYDFIVDNPNVDDAKVLQYAPLGLIPCLVLDQTEALYDSRVIVEYLEWRVPQHIPTDPMERIRALKSAALAQGMMDATVRIRQESMRPENERSATFVQRQISKIERSLLHMNAHFQQHQWCANESYGIADTTWFYALGYLDLRLPDWQWRQTCSALGTWFGEMKTAHPLLTEFLPRM